MFAKLKHVAIVSDRFTLLGKFYESLFGMRSSKPSSDEPRGAAVVGDGYVGLNINSRAPGRQSGLDHFGFEVEDVETIYARLQAKYPKDQSASRPGGRSFAGISTHDPAGNVFDLSKGVGKRRGVYEEGEWQQERRLSHLALRAVSLELLEGSDGGQGRTTPTSRNFGKSLPFKVCFLVLAPHFCCQFVPCKLR